MAVYCPIYDPAVGWCILVCGPKGTYKKPIVSPLYYYHSIGVKPPVGSKFSQEEYDDFELDLYDEEYMGDYGLAPLPVPPVSSLTAPTLTAASSLAPLAVPAMIVPVSNTSSQATAKSAYDAYDDFYDLQNDDYYSSYLNSKTQLSSLSSQLSAAVKNLKKFTSHQAATKPGSLLSSNYSSTKNASKSSSNSSFSLSPSMSYLPQSSVSNGTKKKYSDLPLPSTSSSNLQSSPSTSSGTIGTLPPLMPVCPHSMAAVKNPYKENDSPVSSPYYDNMAYDMYYDDVDESILGDDDVEMSEF